jgi:hypothetical protein
MTSVEELVFKRLKSRTRDFAEANGFIKKVAPPPPPPVVLTPQQMRLQQIADITRKIGGCMEDEVRMLVSLLLEEAKGCVVALPEAKVAKNGATPTGYMEYIKFAVIVLIDNENSHDYEQDTPLLITKVYGDTYRAQGRQWKKNQGCWVDGNYLPETEKHTIRLATEEEIRELVVKFVPDNNLWTQRILA